MINVYSRASRAWRWFSFAVILTMVVAACGGPAATVQPSAPATAKPPTAQPGTPVPGTPVPGTPVPGTPAPGTPAPGTPAPVTPAPGTPAPVTPEPVTPEPGTPAPVTPEPGTPVPGQPLGGTVSIIASWTGAEEDSFRAMIQPWVDENGTQIIYAGTRDMQALLSQAISAGGTGLPDVAGIPGPGLAREWYAAGALKSLDFIDLAAYSGSTPPGMAELGQAEDGKLIGIFTKAAVKGLIWYNVKNFDGTVPATFDALNGLTPAADSLWCNAIESGAASGWPFTDWIEDIVIRQSGPDVYDSWVAGKTKWSSPEIRSAFELLGQVVGKSFGGGTYINATNFGDVGNEMFTDPAGCQFVHQASFISDFFVNQAGAAPKDFDFFVMPDINASYAGALTGGGDMFGMFHSTPQAQSLMQYLTTAKAQSIWAARGGYIAANTGVTADVYASDSDRKAAQALQNASAFRFDGSDSMPGEMNTAFFAAMVKLATDPTNLDSILAELDTVQASAYGP
jgi:alpha-glucoside transport system substrate-binding protein